jgi:ribose transport system substrate-binding protein
MNMNKRFLLASMALTSVLAVSACGSDSASEPASGGATEPKPVAYDGPAKDLPENFPVPTSTGEEFTIGYLQIYGALPTLAVQERGAEDRAEELGVELIVKDAELNPQKQVSQFDELLAEGVDAIVVYPVVPESLGPALAEAKAAGIPVIATNARPDVSKPLGEGYDVDLEAPIDREAYAMAEYGAKEQPGGTFGIIGNAAPIAALKYMADREQYWGERFGLDFVGLVDSKEDTAAGYGPAVSELLAKNPDIDQIWVYNDLVALTAATVVKSSGRDDVKIIANSGTGEAVMEAIKAGDIAMSYQVPWAAQGAALVNAAYSSVTDQNLPLPETVSLLGTAITADNVDDATPTE